MIRNLSATESTVRKSDPRAKRLINHLKVDFEEEMNCDLHVKAALNTLYKNLSKLVDLKEKGKVSSEDAEQAIARLREIDGVLQILF